MDQQLCVVCTEIVHPWPHADFCCETFFETCGDCISMIGECPVCRYVFSEEARRACIQANRDRGNQYATQIFLQNPVPFNYVAHDRMLRREELFTLDGLARGEIDLLFLSEEEKAERFLKETENYYSGPFSKACARIQPVLRSKCNREMLALFGEQAHDEFLDQLFIVGLEFERILEARDYGESFAMIFEARYKESFGVIADTPAGQFFDKNYPLEFQNLA